MSSIFDKKIIKSSLIDISGNIVECEDIEKEYNELKSNYIHVSEYGNKIYKYHIIENTWRSSFWNKFNISTFDKITYTIIINFKDNDEYITFETPVLICMDKQIDLQLALIDKINNSGEVNYEINT